MPRLHLEPQAEAALKVAAAQRGVSLEELVHGLTYELYLDGLLVTLYPVGLRSQDSLKQGSLAITEQLVADRLDHHLSLL